MSPRGANRSTCRLPCPPATLIITSLSITGNGTLDIGNNHIIINYGSGADPIASIAAWIAGGIRAAEHTWTGTGIMSTDAQSQFQQLWHRLRRLGRSG